MCWLYLQNNRFVKCDTCVRLKIEGRETQDKEKRREILKERKAHRELARYV